MNEKEYNVISTAKGIDWIQFILTVFFVLFFFLVAVWIVWVVYQKEVYGEFDFISISLLLLVASVFAFVGVKTLTGTPVKFNYSLSKAVVTEYKNAVALVYADNQIRLFPKTKAATLKTLATVRVMHVYNLFGRYISSWPMVK